MRRTSFLILLLCGLAHPATAAETATPERWAGELVCGHGDGRFTSPRTLLAEDGALRFADDDGSERWTGVLDDDGVAYIHGFYIWDRKKPLFFYGERVGDQLSLEGWRGPKRCVFEAKREAFLRGELR